MHRRPDPETTNELSFRARHPIKTLTHNRRIAFHRFGEIDEGPIVPRLRGKQVFIKSYERWFVPTNLQRINDELETLTRSRLDDGCHKQPIDKRILRRAIPTDLGELSKFARVNIGLRLAQRETSTRQFIEHCAEVPQLFFGKQSELAGDVPIFGKARRKRQRIRGGFHFAMRMVLQKQRQVHEGNICPARIGGLSQAEHDERMYRTGRARGAAGRNEDLHRGAGPTTEQGTRLKVIRQAETDHGGADGGGERPPNCDFSAHLGAYITKAT